MLLQRINLILSRPVVVIRLRSNATIATNNTFERLSIFQAPAELLISLVIFIDFYHANEYIIIYTLAYTSLRVYIDMLLIISRLLFYLKSRSVES